MIIPCVKLLIKIKPHDENRRNPLDLTVTLLTKVGKCFIYMLPFSTLLLVADIIHHRTLFHWSYIQFQNPVWHIILNNCLWSKMTLSLEIILSSLCVYDALMQYLQLNDALSRLFKSKYLLRSYHISGFRKLILLLIFRY